VLVVGLGNPGAEFERTRHNLGADALRVVAERRGRTLRPEKGTRSVVAQADVGGRRVVLAVPQTYVNESGLAVAALVRRFRLPSIDRLVVVHDELDLPSGRVKVKVGGGTGGHNGLKSLHAHLHDPGYVRVRIGIGKPPGRVPGADYVLKRPARAERQVLDVAVQVAADAVEVVVAEGAEAAMRRFNPEPGP
jgi:peptidyl-tRNA hydrolase, PTH1 family